MGGYANFNTAEGTDSLLDLTTGVQNTADGFDVLLSNTTGNYNTAVGAQALISNTIGECHSAISTAELKVAFFRPMERLWQLDFKPHPAAQG